MKRLLTATLVASLTAVSGIAAADNHEQSPTIVPLETYTCHYNEGKGPADFDAATAAWNEWADERGIDDYFAFTLVPYYFGADTFDIAWLGAWTDGNAMGAGIDQWLSEGQEQAAGFFDAVTCDSHSNFAVATIRDSSDEGSSDQFVLTFSDCSMHPDTPFEDVQAGLEAWAQHQADNGHDHGAWMMFPAFGGGDEEFDFKLAESYANFTELGGNYEFYGTGGGWRQHAELVESVVTCNTNRAYTATVRRSMSAGDE